MIGEIQLEDGSQFSSVIREHLLSLVRDPMLSMLDLREEDIEPGGVATVAMLVASAKFKNNPTVCWEGGRGRKGGGGGGVGGKERKGNAGRRRVEGRSGAVLIPFLLLLAGDSQASVQTHQLQGQGVLLQTERPCW